MPGLWTNKEVSVPEVNKRRILVIGLLITFIAALALFFSINQFIDNSKNSGMACAEKCLGESICKDLCVLKSSVDGVATIVFIFLFVLAILATYILLTRGENQNYA